MLAAVFAVIHALNSGIFLMDASASHMDFFISSGEQVSGRLHEVIYHEEHYHN
jgi:hypothetical protein